MNRLSEIFSISLLVLIVVKSGAQTHNVRQLPENRFKIEIDGCPVASANVQSVDIDDLVIEEIEKGNVADDRGWNYRVYGPGDAHYGSISIRSRITPESDSCLHDWMKSAAGGDGGDVRKTISVVILKRDGSEARRWKFSDCFPTKWDHGDYSPNSNVACETIVAKMGRVELARRTRRALLSPEKAVGASTPDLLGFTVEITGSGGSGTDVDSAWETCSGGSLNLEVSDGQGRQGYLSTTPLILSGPVTSERNYLEDWLEDTVEGKGSESFRDLVLREEFGPRGGQGREYKYIDCFPTRYVFPQLAASAGASALMKNETLQIRVNRIEMA
jgi:phage tail-like protein